MKKLLITGSYPPDICGVGDYTSCFIKNASNDWILFYNNNWKISSFRQKIKNIKCFKCDVLVLQYPTQGYGWSLLPQLLFIYFSLFSKIRCYVVLHEFSQRKFKAKIATSLFFLSSRIIFTSEFERAYAIKNYALPKNRSTVINIISNIPAVQSLKKWNERDIDLLYFGHLRPNKGLEDFLFVAKQVSDIIPSIKICIIGQKLQEYEEYTAKLFSKFKQLNISFIFNAEIQEVQNTLNVAKISFLPFPDGISERRGSFLAAISNGSLVLSYKGEFTTKSLENVFIEVTSNNCDKRIIELLNSFDDSSLEKYHMQCKTYLQKNLPKSWNEIVMLYEKFIEK